MEEFAKAFEKLRRRWNLPIELSADYYQALSHIPAHRFEEICARIFHDCDRLPAPCVFTDISSEIGAREADQAIALSSRECAIHEEVLALTDEQRMANMMRLAALVRSFVRPLPARQGGDRTSNNQISQLNCWLGDPVLRGEAIAIIQNAPDLEIVFDDSGQIEGVRRAA